MKGFFRGAFWVSFADFAAKVSNKLDKHPKAVRVVSIITFNLLTFFCVWIILYGVMLHLVPPESHKDYQLMSFGVKFSSTLFAFLVVFGLYSSIKMLVSITKTIKESPTQTMAAVKDVGRGVTSGIKKGAVGAYHVTQKGLGKSVEWTKKRAPKIVGYIGVNLRSGTQHLQLKTAPLRKAVSEGVGKNVERVKGGARVGFDWTRKGIANANEKTMGFLSRSAEKLSSKFRKKKD